jgi:F420-non-reducing hydrogenase iron-sulfur subunit
MITMSAGMGERFAQTATDITKKIRNMGPNPVTNVRVGQTQPA